MKCDCIRYFSVSLGGGWIRCRAMQGHCNGFLGWRWTWTVIQCGNVSFSLHAFVLLWFVVIFQVVEQVVVVLLCGADTTLTHSVHMICSRLTSLVLNPQNFQTTDDDPIRGTSSSPSAPEILFSLPFTRHPWPSALCSVVCLSTLLLILGYVRKLLKVRKLSYYLDVSLRQVSDTRYFF